MRALLSSHAGRDKVHKVLHYGARLAGNARLQALMGSSRRVGRLAGLYFALPAVLEAPSALHRVAAVSDVLYYVADNVPLLGSVGITLGTSRALRSFLENVVGTYSWMLGSLVYIYFAWRALRKRPGSARLRLALAALVFDLLLCVYFARPGRPFSSRAAGLFGVANALCSIAAQLSAE